MRIPAVLLVLLAQAAAQPTFRSGINLVEVDVVVSDKAGQPVRGLTQDDFEILEDAAAGVGVNVDEPGCDDQPLHVHHTFGRLVDCRRDADDGVARDGEISRVPRARRAVDDTSAAQNQIVGRRLALHQHRHEE